MHLLHSVASGIVRTEIDCWELGLSFASMREFYLGFELEAGSISFRVNYNYVEHPFCLFNPESFFWWSKTIQYLKRNLVERDQ